MVIFSVSPGHQPALMLSQSAAKGNCKLRIELNAGPV
jgi:hypothetical protein